MKIIEFKPDLLHPTQDNEIGLDNGFILNAMDPLLSQYKQELFPDSIPVNNCGTKCKNIFIIISNVRKCN